MMLLLLLYDVVGESSQSVLVAESLESLDLDTIALATHYNERLTNLESLLTTDTRSDVLLERLLLGSSFTTMILDCCPETLLRPTQIFQGFVDPAIHPTAILDIVSHSKASTARTHFDLTLEQPDEPFSVLLEAQLTPVLMVLKDRLVMFQELGDSVRSLIALDVGTQPHLELTVFFDEE